LGNLIIIAATGSAERVSKVPNLVNKFEEEIFEEKVDEIKEEVRRIH
jgi:hypothetical protein